jgi:hypothetical protein
VRPIFSVVADDAPAIGFPARNREIDHGDATPSQMAHERELVWIVAQCHERAVAVPAVEPMQKAVLGHQMPVVRAGERAIPSRRGGDWGVIITSTLRAIME